jgi:hypothetical protein
MFIDSGTICLAGASIEVERNGYVYDEEANVYHKWLWFLVVFAVAVGTISCSPAVSAPTEKDATSPPRAQADEAATATSTAEPTIAPTHTVTASPTSQTRAKEEAALTPKPSDPTQEEMVMLAKKDLAERLDLEVEQIELVEANAVEWRDGSLGCPQPGMMYTQVLQDGLRILLGVGKEIYAYHSGGSRPPFLCDPAAKDKLPAVSLTPARVKEEVSVMPKPSASPDPALEELIEQAKEDLTKRLSVSADQIAVLEAETVVWPDSSLGCPQPGMMYTQVQRDGARVLLGAGGKVYHYHSGGSRSFFLCEHPAKGNKLVPPPRSSD